MVKKNLRLTALIGWWESAAHSASFTDRPIDILFGVIKFPLRIKSPTMKAYIIDFRQIESSRRVRFVVIADSQHQGLDMAWGAIPPKFRSRFNRESGQIKELNSSVFRLL